MNPSAETFSVWRPTLQHAAPHNPAASGSLDSDLSLCPRDHLFPPAPPTPLQVWQMPPGRMLFSTHVLSLEDRAQDRLLSSLGLLFCFWVNYTYYCPSESFLECKPYCFCSLVYPQYLNSAWNKGGVWKFVKWIQWRCEFSCLSYRTCKMFYRKNIMI